MVTTIEPIECFLKDDITDPLLIGNKRPVYELSDYMKAYYLDENLNIVEYTPCEQYEHFEVPVVHIPAHKLQDIAYSMLILASSENAKYLGPDEATVKIRDELFSYPGPIYFGRFIIKGNKQNLLIYNSKAIQRVTNTKSNYEVFQRKFRLKNS